MCGIVIVIGKNSKKATKESLDKIVHRGGDNYEITTVENISFGFTRLAINDSSSKGNQPFISHDNIGLFNAEIYNHQTLTNKYKLNISSKSDSEVILPLYEKFGNDILELLDGFFAGVMYNKKEKQIVFLKDYLGKKPLFFAYDNEREYIVSELKALPEVEYFEIIPKGISVLKNKKIITIKKHHHVYQDIKSILLKESILNAVQKRVLNNQNNKFGIFLSGGLDSSIIAMLVNKFISPKQIHYYCITEKDSDDLKYINIIKDFLNISDNNITYVNLPNDKELATLIKKLIYFTESKNPSIISNGIGAYILSKIAHKDGLKVIISGDGADEIFMGYSSKNIIKKTSEWKKLQKDFIDELYMTELRRIDLACMANSIEVRCPFLDKKVYEMALHLEYNDLFGDKINSLNKNILRVLFEDELPYEIINRQKVSFDIGSGLQKKVIELCTDENTTEIEYFEKIWDDLFSKTLSKVKNNSYFWSYPRFDDVIKNRGAKYQLSR